MILKPASSCRIHLLFLLLNLIAATTSQAENLVTLPQVERTPKLQAPLLFPRIRTIYNLYRNPYQNFYAIDWLDRPLLHDSSLDILPPDQRELENNIRQLNLAMSYDADGLEMLYHGPSHYLRFLKLIEAAERNLPKNRNRIFISLLGHILLEGPEKAADQFEPVLRRLMKSPAAIRIDGKVVIASYRTDYVSPDKLDQFLKLLRQRCGDNFYFIATIATLKGKKLTNFIYFSQAFAANHGKLPESEVEAAKDYLRGYLRVSDGLLMNGSNHVDTVDHQFHKDFYDQFICRLFADVLAEPENRGKLLGLSASLGYVNHIAGGHQLENGTRALRESLTAAYSAKPDFIIMPEWNELNENTCLEPGVNRSFSSQRIIRYFAQKAHGKINPLPGDAIDIPNLIVSQRTVLKGGDSFYLELLNVPDSPEQHFYQVTCTLRDECGKVIKNFPPFQFDSGALQEHRITLSPQEVLAHRVINPELEISIPGRSVIRLSDGLPFTRVQNTWNTNYLCQKQPIRDLAELKSFKVKISPEPNSDVLFDVTAVAEKDKIRNIEILEGDTVVYSYDHSGRLNPGLDDLLLHFYYSSIREIKPFPIKLSVDNGKITYFQDRLRLGDIREDKWERQPEITMNWKSNQNRRGAIFMVNNRKNAVLNITTPLFKETIKLSELEKRGQIVKTSNGTVTFGIEATARAMDLPAPADTSEVTFTTKIKTMNPNPVYRVRLITMSGKSWTKGPYTVPQPEAGRKIDLNFFDSINLVPITVNEDRSRLVDLYYSPTGRNGDIIPGGSGLRWDATLGGGAEYGGVFSTSRSYPDKATNPAPKIVKDGTNELFEFDGVGNYLHFPAEVIPSSSAFTLEFEFKPFSVKNQTLLCCRQEYEGMLEIGIVDRRVQCIFRGRLKEGEKPYYQSVKVTSPLELAAGQWTRVKMVYDLKNIYLSVNGSKPTVTPWSRISWMMFNPASFGGWGKETKNYFHGQLKYLKVRHYADLQP